MSKACITKGAGKIVGRVDPNKKSPEIKPSKNATQAHTDLIAKKNEFIDQANFLIATAGSASDSKSVTKNLEALGQLVNDSMAKSASSFMSAHDYRIAIHRIAEKYFPDTETNYKKLPKEAIIEMREMLATITGGSIHTKPGRSVAPIPGLHAIGAQITDDIVLGAGIGSWLRDATKFAVGGIRAGVRKKADMERLNAMFGKTDNVSAEVKQQADKLRALADGSAERRNLILGRRGPTKNVLMQLPMSFTDLQSVGKKNFVALVSSTDKENAKFVRGGEKGVEDGEFISAEVAGKYYDYLENNETFGNDAFDLLERHRIYAKTPEAHLEYLKATGARSFTDNLMGNVAAVGIKEATAKVLGTSPKDFIPNLINPVNDRNGLMGRVFEDKTFQKQLQNSINRSSGHSDGIGYVNVLSKAIYGTANLGKAFGHALALKDAAISVFAETPLRSGINKEFTGNTIIGQMVRDVGVQTGYFFRTGILRNKHYAKMTDQMLETEWQDVVGSGQFLGTDRTTNFATRAGQRFGGLFHTATGFRAANEAAQIRANGEFIIKMKAAVDKSLKNGEHNWDNLPKEMQYYLQQYYLIDKYAFNDIAKHSKISKKGSMDVFEFADTEQAKFAKIKFQVGMRQNLQQATGRANPFQIASFIGGDELTAQRGTAGREIADFAFPFIPPLVNQLALLRGRLASINYLYKDNPAKRVKEFGILAGTAAGFYISYGAIRVAISDKANDKDTDWLDPQTSIRILTYGAIPMLGFFYGGAIDGWEGLKSSDIAISAITDTLRAGWDVTFGDEDLPNRKEAYEKVFKKLPSAYKLMLREAGLEGD